MSKKCENRNWKNSRNNPKLFLKYKKIIIIKGGLKLLPNNDWSFYFISNWDGTFFLIHECIYTINLIYVYSEH